MGKWAQYSKRGSARQTGSVPAPLAGDWTVGTLAATTAQFNRVGAIPPPGTDWSMLVQLAAGGAPVGTTPIAGATPLTTTGLTTATQYKARAAWFIGAVRISDWSDAKTFTTP